MLREFGVEGVRVQEVVSLEKEVMDFLPHVLRILFSLMLLTCASFTVNRFMV
jgi:hypothetical protein